MRRRAPRAGTRRFLMLIAGIAFAAIPRPPHPAGPGAARAAVLAAVDSSVAAPDSASLTRARSSAAPDTSIAPAAADTSAAPAAGSAATADTTAARADTTSAGSFAAEPPETLRFVPPPGLEPPPSATAASPPAPEEPAKPYGPLPKGVSAPGEKPKERVGIWGLHPAAIIAGLIVVHVLVVRAVTR